MVLPTSTENFGMVVANRWPMARRSSARGARPGRGSGARVRLVDRPRSRAARGRIIRGHGVATRELKRMGARGRDWMIRDFSWAHVAADMESYTVGAKRTTISGLRNLHVMKAASTRETIGTDASVMISAASHHQKRRLRWRLLGLLALIVAQPVLRGRCHSARCSHWRWNSDFLDPTRSASMPRRDYSARAEYARFEAGVALAARTEPASRSRSRDWTEDRACPRSRAWKRHFRRASHLELHSTTTYENAHYTRRLLTNGDGPNGALAARYKWHSYAPGGRRLPTCRLRRRALSGLCDGVSADRHSLWLALREWIGLIVYDVRGRTDALWPSPREAPRSPPAASHDGKGWWQLGQCDGSNAMRIDVATNRAARKWSRKVIAGRVLWDLAHPLFAFSPRPMWAW